MRLGARLARAACARSRVPMTARANPYEKSQRQTGARPTVCHEIDWRDDGLRRSDDHWRPWCDHTDYAVSVVADGHRVWHVNAIDAVGSLRVAVANDFEFRQIMDEFF